MYDFLIKLEEGLDVVTGKRYGNKDQIRLTTFDVFLDGIVRLRA